MKSFNYYPITILNEDEILVLKWGRFYIYNVEFHMYRKLKSLTLSLSMRFLFYCKIIVRLLRLTRVIGVKCGEDVIALAYDGYIYKLNIKEDKCSRICEVGRCKRPLNMIYVSGNNSFCDGLYYGEYISNLNKNICNIYLVDNEDNRKVVYTFEEGAVNHVHALLVDTANDCIWIFTGDFGHAAGIWMAKNNFQSVEPILIGAQEWRSCVATCDKKNNGVIYVTDTPMQQNTLRYLYQQDGRWSSKFLHDVNGSVIYGFDTDKYLFFSSTVESNGIYKNRLDCLTSRQKGDGIRDYYSYLYRFDKESFELKILYRVKKDFYPFVLFQFGTMMFPTGSWKRSLLPVFCIATKKYDLKTILINQ